MSLDFTLQGGKPQSWTDLLPHIRSTLVEMGRPANHSMATVEAIYEELPTLTDAMLTQIPWGMRFSTYVTLVAAMLDPENRYRYLRPSDMLKIRSYMERGDFKRLCFAVGEPRHQPSGEQARAMALLAVAYGKRSVQLQGMELAWIMEMREGPSFNKVETRPSLYVLWAPPIEEMPNNLTEMARHKDIQDKEQLGRLITELSTWLSSYPEMVAQDDEQIRRAIVTRTIAQLLF